MSERITDERLHFLISCGGDIVSDPGYRDVPDILKQHARLRCVAALYFAAAQSYHVSPHDRAVIRKYAAAREAMRREIGPLPGGEG